MHFDSLDLRTETGRLGLAAGTEINCGQLVLNTKEGSFPSTPPNVLTNVSTHPFVFDVYTANRPAFLLLELKDHDASQLN